MNKDVVFHFSKTRAQRSRKFIYMALMCWVYIGAIYLYSQFGARALPASFVNISYVAFSVSSIILIVIAVWHHRHPAVFEAILTAKRLIVRYPGSERWSFDVAVDDIKRFEYRRTLSHAGDGITQHGIVMKDGTFHHCSMNYDLNLNTLHKAVQQVRPDVEFPKTVNKRVEEPFRAC
ncbi:hypothetical protein [Alteromonas oceanisediminis]|uniref:hypothetical protein n=1 Tax=Alteromonas oceanisediminis TaxID=2836180 RepID=UPI001BDA1F01|nr:hypothetical protein [Alteromonas oceanisediminis]MBT0586085.1 hypothetical protein [Alteromonas oceanisediminis]